MRNLSIVFLCCFSLFSFSCSKDDDNDKDCVKDENYITVDLDQEILEPFWNYGFSPCKYTLDITQSFINDSDWYISFFNENSIKFTMYLKDINGIGNYSIDNKEEANLSEWDSGNYIFIFDENHIGNSELSAFTYFSLADSGNIEITKYDYDLGIIVGTFNCMMYSNNNEGETKEISGDFNINLSTFDSCERPCWL